MTQIHCRLLTACVGVFLAAQHGLAADIPLSAGHRTIVLSGQPIDGLSTMETVDQFFGAVINDRGEVAFFFDFTRLQPSHGVGIAVGGGTGPLRLVTRSGAQLPGGPNDTTVFALEHPRITNDGRVTFLAQVTSPGLPETDRRGIWTEAHVGARRNLAIEKLTPVPGADVNTQFSISTGTFTRVNGRGDIVFSSGLFRPGVGPINGGAWIYRNGTDDLQLLARHGEPIPGLPASQMLQDGDVQPLINDIGQVALGAQFDDGATRLLVESTPGIFRTFVGDGTPIPGTNNVLRQLNGDFVFTNAGDMMFRASVEAPGGQLTPIGHWFAAANGDIKPIVANGDPVPGFPGATFGGIQNEPRLGPNRQAVFWADLRGPQFTNGQNDNSVWFWHDGDLQMIAQSGTQAVDAPTGVLFSSFDTFSEPRIGSDGQTAFLATLRGTGINGTNDRGLWVADATGELTLVAREGDRFEVAPGDFRTIQALQVVGRSSTEDGSASPFSSRGDLAFVLDFTDGTSGVFVTNSVAVPEPATLVLIISASVVAAGMAVVDYSKHGR